MKLPGSSGLAVPPGMAPGEWRKPFNISIGLHIALLLLAMLAPDIFESRRKLPEIYTVNLFTAVEVTEPETPAGKPTAAPPAPKPAVREIKPESTKPTVSIAPSKPEIPSPAASIPAKPISLRPRKLKVKVGKTAEEQRRDRKKLSRVVQGIKASAARKEARQAADTAAQDAVSKLADALKTSRAATTEAPAEVKETATAPAAEARVSGPRGTGMEPDFYMKQYLSSVYQKIHDHWILPDLQNWDISLEAVLVIVIERDGTVAKSYFEQKTDNIYFNQFVLKAVKDSTPLPPFPDQLQESTFEIGLRFKPGELL
jgi:colicin import membrane protein